MNNIARGDIVVVRTKKTHKYYCGLVVKTYEDKNSFWYNHISGDTYGNKKWSRFSIQSGNYQESSDVEFIKVISKPIIFKAMHADTNVIIFFHTNPRPITFCLAYKEDHESGGLSYKSNLIEAIKESSENSYFNFLKFCK